MIIGVYCHFCQFLTESGLSDLSEAVGDRNRNSNLTAETILNASYIELVFGSLNTLCLSLNQ